MRVRNVTRKITAWRRFRLPLGPAFFVFFYVYLTFVIDLRWLYHGGGLIDNFPSFYWDGDFFRGFLTYPGGFVEYLSAFLAQSFYSSWLGVVVVTLQAWTIYLSTDYVVRVIGIPQLRGLRFFGPLLLLALYCQYAFHFPTTIGLSVTLAGFGLYMRFTPNRTAGAALFFLLLFLILYIAAGGSALLFVVLCGLYEMLLRERSVLGWVALLSGAAIPYVLGSIVYGVRLYDAYSRLLPFSWRFLSRQSGRTMLIAVYVLYLFLPLTIAFAGIGSRFIRKRSKLVSVKARSNNVFLPALKIVVLTGLTVAMVFVFRKPGLKRSFQVDYFSRHKMWEEVIEIGRRSPYHYHVCHAVNRALYQMGRLGDEMFCFPQHPTALFLTREGTDPVWQKFDTCLELGLVNQAENALSICVETFGERPILLQRLAVVNMVKGNIGAARVFLRTLERVPFWSSVARDYLDRLENDPDLSEDDEIQLLRGVMLHTDYVGNADTLTLLLTENPENRMAYQYGMAWLLLNKNLDGFVQKFNVYHRQSVSKIPRHYQEALLLSRFIKKQSPNIPGQEISEQTKMRFSEFTRAMQQYGQKKNEARVELKEKFGNTYFYYYFLGG